MNTENSLKLFVVFCRTFAALSDADRRDIRRYGLSRSEFGALELLYHKGPQTVQEIGKKVLLTSGSMTYVVDKLVEKGLAIRQICEKDKRITHVALTKDGTQLLDEIFPQHARRITELFSSLTDKQITELTETLKHLSHLINKEGDY